MQVTSLTRLMRTLKRYQKCVKTRLSLTSSHTEDTHDFKDQDPWEWNENPSKKRFMSFSSTVH